MNSYSPAYWWTGIVVLQLCMMIAATRRAVAGSLVDGALVVKEIYSDNFFLEPTGVSDLATSVAPTVHLDHDFELSRMDLTVSHVTLAFAENPSATEPDAFDSLNFSYVSELRPNLTLKFSDAAMNVGPIRVITPLTPTPLIGEQPGEVPVSPGATQLTLLTPGRTLANEADMELDWQLNQRLRLRSLYFNSTDYITHVSSKGMVNGLTEVLSYNWGEFGESLLGAIVEHFQGTQTLNSDLLGGFVGHRYDFRPGWSAIATAGYSRRQTEGTGQAGLPSYSYNDFVWSAGLTRLLPRGFVSAGVIQGVSENPYLGRPVLSLSEMLAASWELDMRSKLGAEFMNTTSQSDFGNSHTLTLDISITRRLNDFYATNLSYRYIIFRNGFSAGDNVEAVSNTLSLGVVRAFEPRAL